MRYYARWGLLVMLLAACGRDTLHSRDDLSIGESVLSVDFESPLAFETGSHPDANLAIENGQYVIRQMGERSAYIWGQAGDPLQNASVEVQAQPQSDYSNNLYGVMCRLDPDGAGYAFLISSDGFGAIARTDGTSFAFVVDWVEDKTIKEGTAQNTVQGICVDDYLALYVNGELVADAEDDHYSSAGQVGLIAGHLVEPGDEAEEVVVIFDDLTVSAAALEK